MVYLSRRRRRRARFWAFALLAVWLLGVAAAHDVTMLVAYTTVTLAAISVDLTTRLRRRARRTRRARSRAHPRGTAT